MGWREDVKFGIGRVGRLFLGETNGQLGTEVLATGAEINDVADKSAAEIVSIEGDIVITQALHANKILVLNKAAGIAVTMPEAEATGDVYTFILGTVMSSNSLVITAADTTNCDFAGVCNSHDEDTANVWNIYVAKQSDSYDIFTMNRTTQGGVSPGFDWVQFTDIKADLFAVQAQLYVPTGSNPATPFSTTA